MKKLLIVLALFGLLGGLGITFAPLASAEEGEDSGAFDEDAGNEAAADDGFDDMQYKKMTVIDFEEVLLEGELRKPTGSVILDRQQLKFKNLIRFRENFEPEMIKSVDKLK